MVVNKMLNWSRDDTNNKSQNKLNLGNGNGFRHVIGREDENIRKIEFECNPQGMTRHTRRPSIKYCSSGDQRGSWE